MTDALAGQIITGFVTLGVAFFGYLKLRESQKKVEVKVDGYAKEVDGMKTELIAATKGQYQAEGELKGKADQKAEQKADAGSPLPAPIDVNIVDQSKPVDVKPIK